MQLIHCKELNLVHHISDRELADGTPYTQRITEEYELDYILSSESGEMVTEGEREKLHAGMLFARIPGTVVQGIARYSSWYLRFQTDDPLVFPTQKCVLPLEQYRMVFQKIYDLHIRRPAEYEYQIDYYLNMLLFGLYREQEKMQKALSPEAPLVRARERMEETWNRNYTLEYYASFSGYSKSHFCRRFREAYGVSPMQYLYELRMQKLCYSLIETDRPVKELMIEHGYKNEQSFYRLFKEQTGETPLSYRRKHRIR